MRLTIPLVTRANGRAATVRVYNGNLRDIFDVRSLRGEGGRDSTRTGLVVGEESSLSPNGDAAQELRRRGGVVASMRHRRMDCRDLLACAFSGRQQRKDEELPRTDEAPWICAAAIFRYERIRRERRAVR